MEPFFALVFLAAYHASIQVGLFHFWSNLWGREGAETRLGLLLSPGGIRKGHRQQQKHHPRTWCLHRDQSVCVEPKSGKRKRIQSSNNNDNNAKNSAGISGGDAQKSSVHESTTPYPFIDQSMCVAAAEWQNTFKTNCNIFHEVDMRGSLDDGRRRDDTPSIDSVTYNNEDQLYELGSGKWRSAWKLQRNAFNEKYQRSNQAEGVVLKTLNYIDRVHFDSLTFQRNQIDAKISERVSSPYSVHIYGFCGQSALNEVADRTLGAEMKEMWSDAVEAGRRYGVDGARGQWSKSFLKRIRYARDTARALAYVHTIDAPPTAYRKNAIHASWNVTIAHNDFRVRISSTTVLQRST